MLGITTMKTNGSSFTLKLGGKIQADLVKLLERECWSLISQQKSVRLFFSDVSYVDLSGVEMIRKLPIGKVTIVNASNVITELLHQGGITLRESGIPLPVEFDMSDHSFSFVDIDHSDQIDSEEVSAQFACLRRDELGLVEKLRSGDESAFVTLLDRYQLSLIRLALAYVSEQSVAEEVVQDTWLAVLEGLRKFEGRSSLKTWIFKILTNKAKTRGVRESRHISVSPVDLHDENEEPAVDPSQFRRTGDWAAEPPQWDTPETQLLTKEGTAYLQQAIAQLPANLQRVLILRDVEGLSSKDVCDTLEISEGNQRVLLHRARSRVRRALDQYMTEAIRPT